MKVYPFSIISPQGVVFQEEVGSIIVPGQEGYFGILANHAPLVAKVGKGVLEIRMIDKNLFFVVGDGLIEMDQSSQGTLLTNSAETAKDKKEAEALLKSALHAE